MKRTLHYWKMGVAFGAGAITTSMINFKGNLLHAKTIETPSYVPGPSYTDPHPALNRHGRPLKLGPPGPLCYANHCLEFDVQRKTPIWVAEHLTKDMIYPAASAANRKLSSFKEDPVLPELVRPTNNDFWNSGWSRGHMAAAGNNKHSQKSMDDTFFLTNIVPQV